MQPMRPRLALRLELWWCGARESTTASSGGRGKHQALIDAVLPCLTCTHPRAVLSLPLSRVVPEGHSQVAVSRTGDFNHPCVRSRTNRSAASHIGGTVPRLTCGGIRLVLRQSQPGGSRIVSPKVGPRTKTGRIREKTFACLRCEPSPRRSRSRGEPARTGRAQEALCVS